MSEQEKPVGFKDIETFWQEQAASKSEVTKIRAESNSAIEEIQSRQSEKEARLLAELRKGLITTGEDFTDSVISSFGFHEEIVETLIGLKKTIDENQGQYVLVGVKKHNVRMRSDDQGPRMTKKAFYFGRIQGTLLINHVPRIIYIPTEYHFVSGCLNLIEGAIMGEEHRNDEWNVGILSELCSRISSGGFPDQKFQLFIGNDALESPEGVYACMEYSMGGGTYKSFEELRSLYNRLVDDKNAAIAGGS